MILPLFKRPVGSALDNKKPRTFRRYGAILYGVFMGQVISIG